jgi:hypothetical protein
MEQGYEPVRGSRQMPLIVAVFIAVLAILGVAFVWPW